MFRPELTSEHLISLNTLTEKEILLQIAAGDEAAFRIVFDRCEKANLSPECPPKNL